MYTLCPKNIPRLICYNFFDLHKSFWWFWGRNDIEIQVSYQTIIYFHLPVTIGSALFSKLQKPENWMFLVKYWITALPEFNQLLLYFFSPLCWLATRTHAESK